MEKFLLESPSWQLFTGMNKNLFRMYQKSVDGESEFLATRAS